MATSKKPRKKYRPRVPSIGLSAKFVEDFKASQCKSALRLMERLPRGNAEMLDIFHLRELLATTLVGVSSRGCFDQAEVDAAVPVLCEAAKMIHPIVERTKKTNGRIVCKGEELNTILEAVDIAYSFITDSADVCPQTVAFEYMVALKLIEGRDDTGEEPLSRAKVKRMMEKEKHNFSLLSSYRKAALEM